jgi:DNA-binding response OmpR family regulator
MERDSSVYLLARKQQNRELLTECLRRYGHGVESAGDIDDFDRLIGEPDGTDCASLAIVDFDGFSRDVIDVCRRLRERGIPVVVLARKLPQQVQGQVFAAGASSAIEKPVRKADLVQTVQALARTGNAS